MAGKLDVVMADGRGWVNRGKLEGELRKQDSNGTFEKPNCPYS